MRELITEHDALLQISRRPENAGRPPELPPRSAEGPRPVNRLAASNWRERGKPNSFFASCLSNTP